MVEFVKKYVYGIMCCVSAGVMAAGMVWLSLILDEYNVSISDASGVVPIWLDAAVCMILLTGAVGTAVFGLKVMDMECNET